MLLKHFYALIMAGGGGTRLWPLSRQIRPKQMLPLIEEEQTMFQMTVRRLPPLLPPERVFVITGQDQVDALRADVPEVPAENFIVEPFGRDSGPAAGLGILAIAERDPDAIVAVLSADHHIAQTERFRAVLHSAAELAQRNMIVTLGIPAYRPATDFGYIRRGEFLERLHGFDCFHAEQFTEKPDRERAMKFLKSGLYNWNSGMFILGAHDVLEEYRRQQPEMYDLLMQIRPLLGASDFTAQITPYWEKMPKLSIDYAIMEGATNIAVIPVDIGWSDVGTWGMLFDVLEGDENGNIIRGAGNGHILLDTVQTLVVSNRMVVTIGLEDLVVVDTDDVLLVCHRDHAQDVRKVVKQLRDQGKDSYL
jgi:mannose-1-phosphate guanylyltransferase